MHAVQIYAGRKKIRVGGQSHGGQITAIRSAPQANALGVDIGQALQVFSGRHDVFILGTASPSAVGGLAEVPAVHNSCPVIHCQHHVASARQVLIHRVSVLVVVHVVEAKHHLADRSAVDENQGGPGGGGR